MKGNDWQELIGKLAVSVFLLGIILGPFFYGLYSAFSASIILGIIVLILEPAPYIIGILELAGTNVCVKIVTWLGGL